MSYMESLIGKGIVVYCDNAKELANFGRKYMSQIYKDWDLSIQSYEVEYKDGIRCFHIDKDFYCSKGSSSIGITDKIITYKEFILGEIYYNIEKELNIYSDSDFNNSDSDNEYDDFEMLY